MANLEDMTEEEPAMDMQPDAVTQDIAEGTLEVPIPSEKKTMEPNAQAVPEKGQENLPAQEASVALGSLDVELSFFLGRQLIPYEEVRSLVEGKIISLAGTDFEVSILLEGKKIAQAQLVLVEGIPSLQIIKTVSHA